MGNLQLLWGEVGQRLRAKDYGAIDTDILSMVDRSLAGTQSLLDNLFSFAKSQQSQGDPNEIADVALTLLQVKDQWEPAATTKGVAITVGIQDTVLVRSSAATLDAVFRNLVGNAVKFTPRGGSVTISLLTTGQNGEVEVEVADTGIGMSAEQLQRTFQMESKFSRPGTDGERGSGFGLVLARELIAGWGGAVTLESEIGRGTRVRVTIPKVV